MSLSLNRNLNLVLHYDLNWKEQNRIVKALSKTVLVQNRYFAMDCCMMMELIPDDMYCIRVLKKSLTMQELNKSG
jgi:hypothetical protein